MGRLRIFLGYTGEEDAADAMLECASEMKKEGINVIIGYASDDFTCPGEDIGIVRKKNGRMDTEALAASGADVVMICGAGNPGERLREDIETLLGYGKDVFCSLDLGEIDDMASAVSSVTGESCAGTVPGYFFDRADQVDITDPADSRFEAETVSALRAMADERTSRSRTVRENFPDVSRQDSEEHVLVCLSSSPSNARIIRSAARMARAFGGHFTALFVETPQLRNMSEGDRQRLEENKALAVSLGAYPETVYGDDVAYQIAEYSALSGVTRIVVGRSTARKHFWNGPSLTDKLLDYASNVDIHIIPDSIPSAGYRENRKSSVPVPEGLKRVAINSAASLFILAGATALSILFYNIHFSDSNIIMVYILGTLLTSIATSHRIYSLVSSVSSVFIYNYLFTEPRYSLAAYDTGYPVTFIVMFLTAYITGTLAARYKAQAGEAAKNAYRTKVLFDADRMMSKAGDAEDILRAAGSQIARLLRRRTVITGSSGSVQAFAPDGADTAAEVDDEHRQCAAWVLENGRTAGRGTDIHPGAKDVFYPVSASMTVYAAVGIDITDGPIEAAENSILLSMLGEAALALENEKNLREKEETAVLARGEQLRANILRAISHDLRTPLTVISGNAGNLIRNSAVFDEETKQSIYRDIQEDAGWLVNMVENLLYATRIEEGRMSLDRTAESLGDIIEEALSHIRDTTGRGITVDIPDDLIIVKADPKLIVQVLINLVDNAFKYSPVGSPVTLTARIISGEAVVSIADEGPGIPDEEKEKIFDRFYRMEEGKTDTRRSLGLGLYLARCIVEAHGGTIRAEDNHPCGTILTFTLPLEDIDNEQ
ncbi:MAG: sensor histidine kinase KdpD [Eubacteriaceae bacterium]|nr:sensor histidine kinase KdpD [Eubacteriaceae bacterium]